MHSSEKMGGVGGPVGGMMDEAEEMGGEDWEPDAVTKSGRETVKPQGRRNVDDNSLR